MFRTRAGNVRDQLYEGSSIVKARPDVYCVGEHHVFQLLNFHEHACQRYAYTDVCLSAGTRRVGGNVCEDLVSNAPHSDLYSFCKHCEFLLLMK